MTVRSLLFLACISAAATPAHADEDPMLAPPAAAPERIASWHDAIARIRHAPDYAASAAAVQRAAADSRIALAAVLPTLTAVGGYQHGFRASTIPARNVWSAGGVLAWHLDARSINELGTADRRIELSQLSLAEQRRELAGAFVDAMLETLTAERIADLGRVSLRAAIDRLALTRQRLSLAKGTELDVDRAQQDVEVSRAELVDGDEALRRACEGLGELAGSPTPIAATPDLDLDGLERAIAASCRPATDLDRRADVAAARKRVEIASRGIDDANLRFAPSLDVTSEVSDVNVAAIGPESNWIVGATVTVPLYDGGARYGAKRKAKAELAEARAELDKIRVAALIDAARADRAVGVATQSRDIGRRRRDLAAQVDQRIRQAYAAGLGTSLDLVTSAQALRGAEIELAAADFQVARARAGALLANAECVF
ncbi:MAG: Heavy metal efflux outer membrane protein CzcC family [Myxococcales bacterium]|nr:Heavy metal efflux outer membrane protein CzcC family [Myxococcales bacterium]